jgi:hypothetical protein
MIGLRRGSGSRMIRRMIGRRRLNGAPQLGTIVRHQSDDPAPVVALPTPMMTVYQGCGGELGDAARAGEFVEGHPSRVGRIISAMIRQIVGAIGRIIWRMIRLAP